MKGRPQKLTPDQRAELAEMGRKGLPAGSLRPLAERYGVSIATISRCTRAEKPPRAPRRTKLIGGAIEALPISQASSVTFQATEGECEPLEGIVEAPVSPLDTAVSLDVLRAIRDSVEVPPETRARAAVSLLQHGAKASDAEWKPPTTREGWASVLVELLNEEPPAVRGLVRLALEHA